MCKVKGHTEKCVLANISIAEHSYPLFSAPCARLTQLEEECFADSSPFELFRDHLHWFIVAHLQFASLYWLPVLNVAITITSKVQEATFKDYKLSSYT